MTIASSVRPVILRLATLPRRPAVSPRTSRQMSWWRTRFDAPGTGRRQTPTFLAIGTVCTVAYLALQVSNAANRRWTFGVTDLTTVVRHLRQIFGLLAVHLVVNSLAGTLVELMVPTLDCGDHPGAPT